MGWPDPRLSPKEKRARTAEYVRAWRAKRKAEGLCQAAHCENPSDGTLCPKHAAAHALKQKRRRKKSGA
jgi:hypothetical protein